MIDHGTPHDLRTHPNAKGLRDDLACPNHAAPTLVVMGVAGCGKTTIASAFAADADWIFLEGDAFHPFANVEKMSRGIPLDDNDRTPWLKALGQEMSILSRSGRSVVAACSALRKTYRDTLRAYSPELRFVHLHCSTERLERRLAQRTGHFADGRILESQLATLEPPAGADTLVVDSDRPVSEIVAEIKAFLSI